MQSQKVNLKKLTSLSLGSVDLNVQNLSLMTGFYINIMGLQILQQEDDFVKLGYDKKTLLTLHKQENLSFQQKNHAGLYHFAILYSSRKKLSETIYRILKDAPQLFSGSADHLVSEAFYFSDPEGNGIELYFDRDRSAWEWENNEVKMASMYIDPVDYIKRYIVLEEKNSQATIGHIHLKVGDIEKAKQFYVDVLGFDKTAELPGALFISTDGYHHHIGMNTWESFATGERTESYGLKEFAMNFSDEDVLNTIRERLKTNKIQFTEKENSLIFHDPWKNKIIVNYLQK